MTRVAILGGSGYTALELIKLLLRHPEVEIVALTSRQEDRPHIAEVHPSLAGRLDLSLEPADPESLADRADCVFSCLPHAASAEICKSLLDRGLKVVDFSADYRLDCPEMFATWYATEHVDPDRLTEVPYGLPELFREQIRTAQLVANPGCYPTSAVLALAPLLSAGLIEPTDMMIDSKSGVSGAGRALRLSTLYPECNESISAYNIGGHRHTPEIELILAKIAGIADAPAAGRFDAQRPAATDVEVVFSPHLTPMDRGILTTAYSRPTRDVTAAELTEVLAAFYRDEPFVRVADRLPGTKDVATTNFCDIAVRVVRGRVVTVSAIDNLVKGASGAAVQNFNLMFGYDETTALL